ncbi:MAG: DUF192 domain-containing protein [Chloroflexaceae bacterium]|nr:DUF192 domain-containing protein [Chloroflexaceae bacterium]
MAALSLTIVNQTRSTTLATACEVAQTFLTRWKGLMGHPGLEPGQGLIIYPEWSIHTFFMRFPIDVLFLSEQDQVLGLREAMPPNRPYAGVWGARYVIELPPGVINTTATSIGDQLSLTPPRSTWQQRSGT